MKLLLYQLMNEDINVIISRFLIVSNHRDSREHRNWQV